MNITEIENNLQSLVKDFTPETFIYQLLLAYGLPKASISRLQNGNLNLSKSKEEISWKKKVIFRLEMERDLHETISELLQQVSHDQRFVIVTDFRTLLAVDTRTLDRLDISLQDLPRHYDFFLPWAGMEKAQHQNENPADVKAAERMAKLFDEIKKDNPEDSPEFIHGLNVFLSRLLFCFFAEDTNIFKEGQFTNSVSSHTQADGSDLHDYLDKLFDVLNTHPKDRQNIPAYLQAFPYVNGGLFRQRHSSPSFTRRSRQALISSGEMNWSAINPDIFGSMIQAVITPEHRGGLGMHYTSVPNIMKVIEPLFLDELYEAFEKAKNNPKRLSELLYRLGKIKIFDPACGSGNFLIIAYKELRKLEMAIIHHLQELKQKAAGFQSKSEQLSFIPKSQLNLAASFQVELFSRIQLSQFYGIELDDFAHEIAQLSLWLAEHQMNVEFRKEFGSGNPSLPLKESGNIVHGNACRLDWEEVCPKKEGDEIYILGNPPYLGSSMQSKEQKNDMAFVFTGIKGYKNLDYIACWFIKATFFITNTICKYAYVSTNSINQGEQVAVLWAEIISRNQEIFFAYPSFPWKNSAKGNAAVIVSIIGVRVKSHESKTIYLNSIKFSSQNINPYLIDGNNILVQKRAKPISNFPLMEYGTKTVDGGNLTLTHEEKVQLLQSSPGAMEFIKPFTGSFEYINNIERYCLFITKKTLEDAQSIPVIERRINSVMEMRLKSQKKATINSANYPYEFGELRYKYSQATILIPRVSSVRRNYIPFGFLNKDYLISDSAQAIYNAEPWILGVLLSIIHVCWVKIVGGRLKSDYRYSSVLCYNTFPFPPISDQRKQEITQSTFRILEERERHSEKTLAQLYDPNKMPEGLREAHRLNDLAVERCYRSRPFGSDEERLEYLFKLYEQMIANEKEKNTLFVKEKKKSKN